MDGLIKAYLLSDGPVLGRLSLSTIVRPWWTVGGIFNLKRN